MVELTWKQNLPRSVPTSGTTCVLEKDTYARAPARGCPLLPHVGRSLRFIHVRPEARWTFELLDGKCSFYLLEAP